MGGFKRFLLALFSLVGLITLVILCVPWFGYGTYELTNLVYLDSFWIFLEVCLAMTVGFLVFNLGRALFSRKRNDIISVMNVNGGDITVTKSAVASQATHIVEGLGLGTTKDVIIDVQKGSAVVVDVKVVPYESIDVTAEAPVLHEALVTGLGAMCGEKLDTVNVEFLEPKHGSSLVVPVDESDEAGAAEETAVEQPQVSAPVAPEAEASSDATPDDTGDITIPMRSEKAE